MNKYLKIASLLFLTIKITIIGQSFDTSVIKNASYYVCKNVPFSNKGMAIYYTFDGNPLKAIDFDSWHPIEETTRQSRLNKKIDPNSPSPRPIYYKIKKHYYFIKAAQYKIHFYDKYGNDIAVYFYDKNRDLMSQGWWWSKHYKFPQESTIFNNLYPNFPLDLSIVQKKKYKIREHFNNSVIKSASYYICKEIDGDKGIAVYYTFDGNPLTAIDFDNKPSSHSFDQSRYSIHQNTRQHRLDKKIDPNSPLPQPAYYRIIYCPSIKSSGNRVYFYDKYGSVLQWNWYIRPKKLIRGKLDSRYDNCTFPLDDRSKKENFNQLCPNFELDLSVVQEKK